MKRIYALAITSALVSLSFVGCVEKSTELTEAERESILVRIDGAPAGVASATVALANRLGTLQALALAD